MKRSPVWACSDDEFKAIVAQCTSYSGILSHFGLLNRGENSCTVKDRIKSLGISFKYIPHPSPQKKPLKDHLIYGTYLSTSCKKRIIEDNLIENKCGICGLPPIWNGKKLVLHIDHINGNPLDNRLINLRLICPNCHSQTMTYCGKNSKRVPVKICKNCKKVVDKNSKLNLCKKCYIEYRKNNPYNPKKVIWPTKEELAKLIEEYPMVKIAKNFGVSDNAVKKWAKKYGLPLKNRLGYWTKSKPVPPRKELVDAIFKRPLYLLAKDFNVDEKLIRKWLRCYNIKIPDNKFRALKQWEKRKQGLVA